MQKRVQVRSFVQVLVKGLAVALHFELCPETLFFFVFFWGGGVG